MSAKEVLGFRKVINERKEIKKKHSLRENQEQNKGGIRGVPGNKDAESI